MRLMQAALQVLLQQMYKPLASEIKFRETMVATKVGVSALTGQEGTRVRKVHGAPFHARSTPFPSHGPSCTELSHTSSRDKASFASPCSL